MIDIKKIKNNEQELILNFNKRNFNFNYIFFLSFESKIKIIKKNLYNEQYKYKFISSSINVFKNSCLNFNHLIKEITQIKTNIMELKEKLKYLEKKLKFFLSCIPNVLHKSVPFGVLATHNIELRTFKKKNYTYKESNKDFETNKNYIDFNLSAKISGAGFTILKNELASLHRALGNYMLDLHIYQHKYIEIYSPLMVNEESMFNSGHFPKFYYDQFNISNSNLWLIPTAEVVLTNMINNTTLLEKSLPLKLVSKTACFRKERGNYGSKVKGLIRQHQFDKVELLNITMPEKSYDALEELTYHAEKVLQNLNLPYRTIILCSGDVGFTSTKTYDIEAWFPKRKTYIEVSSCSNTETFQSRRMNAKIKRNNDLDYPHILNGSGLAIGRVLLAIIENYSNDIGEILIPDVLVKYMNGIKKITS